MEVNQEKKMNINLTAQQHEPDTSRLSDFKFVLLNVRTKNLYLQVNLFCIAIVDIPCSHLFHMRFSVVFFVIHITKRWTLHTKEYFCKKCIIIAI